LALVRFGAWHVGQHQTVRRSVFLAQHGFHKRSPVLACVLMLGPTLGERGGNAKRATAVMLRAFVRMRSWMVQSANPYMSG
jgi:hypothetical protein